MTPPDKGEMRLYPSIRPPLNAGAHTLHAEQSISGGGPIDPVERHLVVDAPRFSMAGAEILSVFPPPNAVGAFANRLPQIALKRRTLPWERAPGTLAEPIATRRPWLALVVLADGEGNFRTGVPVDQAMPAAVRSRMGVSETGTCDVIELSRTVVDKVFPRENELELLCHVREVNLLDTEFATSDDDGFVSVVISSRLPRPPDESEDGSIAVTPALAADPTLSQARIALRGSRSTPTEGPPSWGAATLGARYAARKDCPVIATSGARFFDEGVHDGTVA